MWRRLVRAVISDVRRSPGPLALLVTACFACGISETRSSGGKNPTEWTYARPLPQVAECLIPGRLVADRWGAVTELSYNEPGDVRRTERVFETMLVSLGQCLGETMPQIVVPGGKAPEPAACERIGGR